MLMQTLENIQYISDVCSVSANDAEMELAIAEGNRTIAITQIQEKRRMKKLKEAEIVIQMARELNSRLYYLVKVDGTISEFDSLDKAENELAKSGGSIIFGKKIS